MLIVGAELFHANGRTDRQTDVTKLIVPFRKFANAPGNVGLRKTIDGIFDGPI
jgi:hypothetical protein